MNFYRTIGLIVLTIILTACASTPDVAVMRAPSPEYPNVTASKPAPQAASNPTGSCIADAGKVGRPYTVMHSGGSTGGLTMMILCLDHKRAVSLTKNVSNAPPADQDQANHFLLALKTLDIFHNEMDDKN